MEILKFIFSSFWTWSGTFMLLAVVAGGLISFKPLAGIVTIVNSGKT